MRVDLLHEVSDGIGQPPCGLVAMTLNYPHSPGEIIKPTNISWPHYGDHDLIICGTCQGYAGESLSMEFATRHTCVPLHRPDGGSTCRAGCNSN